jgi:creatinine amidohydrolase
MTAGLDRLRHLHAELPAALHDELNRPDPTAPFDPRATRCIVTTGIGSSAAHARFFAQVLAECLGLPARFTPTGSLGTTPISGRSRDALVVFSQGLSPNARFAFEELERWGAVVLVTAQGLSQQTGDRSRWLDALRARGVAVIDFAAPDEFGMLVRVVGPLLGFAACLSLARSLGRSAGLDVKGLSVEPDRIVRRVRGAATRLDALVSPEVIAQLHSREIVLAAAGGYGELLENLRTKVLEGMLRPMPTLWDGLEFAHGGLQQLWPLDGVLLHLSRAGRAEDDVLADALHRVVDPDRHGVIRLEAEDFGPASVFEHEALMDVLLLRWLEASDGDPTCWPAQGADGPLYDRSPPLVREGPALGRGLSVDESWEALTWPECERQLLGGNCTAVLALGSTEQHGPHLPLATDTWIAQWLSRRVVSQIPGAVQLPVLSLGCAEEHAAFPGTLSLTPATFERVVGDVLSSLAKQGFRRTFVFSAHGGNLSPLCASRDVFVRLAAPMSLTIYDDHTLLWERLARSGQEFGVSAEEQGLHAGELETSILRAFAPEFVRLDRAEPGLLVSDGTGPSLFYPSLRDHAPDGVVGDPTRADASRAEAYLEAWVEELVRFHRSRVDQ